MKTHPYAWPCGAFEMATQVSDNHFLDWNDTSIAHVMAAFIELHCDPAAFEQHLNECAQAETL